MIPYLLATDNDGDGPRALLLELLNGSSQVGPLLAALDIVLLNHASQYHEIEPASGICRYLRLVRSGLWEFGMLPGWR